VSFTQRAREGKFNYFSPQLDSSALGGERLHSGREGEQAGSGYTRRREVDSEEMWTWERNAHLVDPGAMRT
jgi:hypothetical protein